MKINDEVTITKPGILNGQTGVITAIRYEVNCGAQGVHYLADGEILPEKKDNSAQALKQVPESKARMFKEALEKQAIEVYSKLQKEKQVKPKKEVKVKRAYVRKK